MTAGGARVVFVGAGPGAADLITLRGARAIAAAELVLWARSLVMEELVLAHAREDAELVDSAPLTLEDQRRLYERALREGLRVARVHCGDPSIYSAVGEQIRVAEEIGLPYEIVPGVGSLGAAAAALGQELTVPERAQSLILTRRQDRSPMPRGERLQSLAEHRATMALFLSVGRIAELQDELLAGGYPAEEPCAVVYRASWPDELAVRCALGELADRVGEAGIERQALVLIGPALGKAGTRSHLYDPKHGHRFREAVR
ncbi:MAG: precorrin-4 C(11)-methyltransferase [Solirubrobacterales bacterium]